MKEGFSPNPSLRTFTIAVTGLESQWLFSVEDNGIEIPGEFYRKKFQLFRKLHYGEQFPGTGVGLPVAKKIVELHGGRMGVTSQVGQGSSIFFTMPR